MDMGIGWIGTYRVVELVVLAAVPFAVLMACALTGHRRRHGMASSVARRRSLAEVGMVYGTVPLVWLAMLPGPHTGTTAGVSLVPFRDLATMPVYQIVGNLLGLAALGLFAPCASRHWRPCSASSRSLASPPSSSRLRSTFCSWTASSPSTMCS
jgi:hypothetical protein